MNTFKKVLAAAMCLAMLLTIMPMTGTAVASGSFEISCSSAAVDASTDVTLDIVLTNNPGFSALNIAFVYDTTYLTQKTLTNKVTDLYMSAGTSVVWDGATNYTNDGVLATITFAVAANAPAGDYEIEIVFWGASNDNFEDVPATVKSGKVTVKCPHANKTEHPAYDPACTATGNYKYYTCSCGVVFKADGVTETTVADVTIPVLGHDWSGVTCDAPKTCMRTGCGQTEGNALGHDWTQRIEDAAHLKTAAAKCTEYHTYWYDCVRCDAISNSEFFAGTTAGVHSYKEKLEDNAHLVSGTGLNCQDAKEYYYDCEHCDKIGTQTFVSSTNGSHQIEATWSTKDGKHYHKCVVTDCTYIEDETNCSGGTASCTKKAICSTCQKEYGQLLDHDLTHHNRYEADHIKPGNIEYWTCDDCGKYFGDASAKKEITQKDTVIAKIPHSHSGIWRKDATQHWNECSCGDKINVYNHNYDNTCDTSCNTCGHTRTITHTWKSTLSYSATQHWTECSVCGEKKDVENHAGGTADCLNKAICDDCKQSYGETIGCNFTAEKAEAKYLKSAATCKDVAVYYKSCTVCGKASTETFTHGTVDTNNHIGGTEVRNASAETCTTDGYTGDTHCKGCNTKITTGSVIPAGHKLDKVAANAATHDAAGNIEHYVCSVCKKLYADDKATNLLTEAEIVIAKGEHTYTMQSDVNGHWKSCECSNKIEEAAHTYGEWVTTKEADVGVEGSKERTCTVCGYRQIEKILATTTPATRDDTQIGLLLAMLLISACGMITMLFLVPQRKGKYQR